MDITNHLISLFTLIILEIILGIDNLIFLSILIEKLPKIKRARALFWGLTCAWLARVILLFTAICLIKLNKPLITIYQISFSIHDLFLLVGGMFLIAKSTQEIHNEMNIVSKINQPENMTLYLVNDKNTRWIILQIVTMDIIFSIDSILTAVGLATNFWVMSIAITCAIFTMHYTSKFIGNFIATHPSIKILAFSFLILIGMVLVADGFSFHLPRGYIYFAMGFAFIVEVLNIYRSSKHKVKS